jgi:hypothetical protein
LNAVLQESSLTLINACRNYAFLNAACRRVFFPEFKHAEDISCLNAGKQKLLFPEGRNA